MVKTNLVQIAGQNSLCTSKIIKVRLLCISYVATNSLLSATEIITFHVGRREIRDLHVKCDSIERGCKWKGTVGTLEEHVATCDFIPVPCPKECKEGSSIQMIIRKKIGCTFERRMRE